MNIDLDETEMNEEKLKQLFDTYGADLSRMPDHLAKQVKPVLKNAQANKTSDIGLNETRIEKLLNEAQRLDKTLDQVRKTPKFDLEALENRIFDQAFATTQPEVISFNEKKAKLRGHNKVTSVVKNYIGASELLNYKSTALIAASLLTGLLLGSLGTIDHLLFDENSLMVASNNLTDDVLYLGTEYSLDSAVFSTSE